MRTLMLFGFVVTALAVGAPPAGAAWPHLPNVNLQVESATGDQIQPFSVADGTGGFFLIWQDGRAGVMQTYAQHLNSAGLPQWAPDGVPVSPSPGDETYARVASDGNGGLIVAWADTRSGNTDVYAQRLNAAGTAQWTVTGVPLVVAAGIQFAPQLVSDGAGGAIVVWQDQRSGNYDVYAQHVNAAGTPQWAANGLAV